MYVHAFRRVEVHEAGLMREAYGLYCCCCYCCWVQVENPENVPNRDRFGRIRNQKHDRLTSLAPVTKCFRECSMKRPGRALWWCLDRSLEWQIVRVCTLFTFECKQNVHAAKPSV